MIYCTIPKDEGRKKSVVVDTILNFLQQQQLRTSSSFFFSVFQSLDNVKENLRMNSNSTDDQLRYGDSTTTTKIPFVWIDFKVKILIDLIALRDSLLLLLLPSHSHSLCVECEKKNTLL